jgi:hypothetical protein
MLFCTSKGTKKPIFNACINLIKTEDTQFNFYSNLTCNEKRKKKILSYHDLRNISIQFLHQQIYKLGF